MSDVLPLAESNEKPKKKGGPGRPFQKGVSGNKGGRPRTREANELIRAMFAKYGKKVVARLYEMALCADKRVALAAIDMIMDRNLGKPSQFIEHSGGLDLTTMTTEERQARIKELLGKNAADGS